ncbi:uncharacterized protein LOC108511380 [Phoenix dactylifera]|uniref:Uncharacterized protein LOC108511380 n=1 Tax=Phoenix dactylifera TaxID=42345 RepID=A0A8B7MUG8_PHODC|nr:uncharacterized protein LOC108511380 [Phoenix dactylifera]
MDDEIILESLGSLWFFSNILSPSSPITCINAKNTHDSHPSDPRKPKQPGPTTQILQSHQLKSPDICVQAVGKGAGSGEQATKPENHEASKYPKESFMEQRKKKSNREQGMKKLHRFKEEFTVLGLSFGELGPDGRRPFYTSWKQQRMARSYGLRQPFRCHNMPPLSDGLAMKEHLKSWAHAVACTVR